MKRIALMITGWYLALTLLALFGAHSLTLSAVFSGLLLMWISALLFLAGFSSQSHASFSAPAPVFTELKSRRTLILLSAGSICLSVFLIRFYTGNTISDVIISLFQQESLYARYQTFFREQELWRLSLSKIPAILLAMLLKLLLLYVFIKVLVLDKRLSIGKLAALSTVGLSYMLFSVARGTSFELFELFLLLWFSLTVGAVLEQKAPRVLKKSNIALLIVAVIFVVIYNYNVSIRSDLYCATTELCINPDALIYQISPAIGNLTFKLSGYFTFGIYFSSSFINSIWLSSPMNVLEGLAPLGLGGYGEGVRDLVCGGVIDCGVAWIPDTMILFQYLGFVGLLGLIFFLGRTAKALILSSFKERSFHGIAVLFFIVLMMFSLPIGNFLFSSSSNALACLVVLLIHLLSRPDIQLLLKIRPRARVGTTLLTRQHVIDADSGAPPYPDSRTLPRSG